MKFTVKKPLIKMLVIVLSLQFLLLFTPLAPRETTAAPLTSLDNVWEGISNDDFGSAFGLGDDSIKNNPNTPLNVSSWSPDYYRFDVYAGFYFSVYLEFNQTNVYNATGQLYSYTDPPFLADIDMELYASNLTLLDSSNGNSNEEAMGGFSINSDDTYYIVVTAENPDIGYETEQYSTVYNMSVVMDDVWENNQPNDNIKDIDDPRDGLSDDEITPGSYSNLRFSHESFSDYGNIDWYCIWFYNTTDVTITVAAFVDGPSPEPDGPSFHIYNEKAIDGTLEGVEKFDEDGASDIDTISFTTTYDGWYYLFLDNSPMDTADYYQLNITIEDAFEGTGNDVNATATGMTEGHYAGLVISTGFDDWYKVAVSATERILVELKWFSFIGDLHLTLYENDSVESLVGAAVPIFGGLRIGPHRANKPSTYYIHISGDNIDPRYYNLTIAVDEIDDWAEDNDDLFHPYLLPTQSQEIRPTIADPFAGLFSQSGDWDFFVISLLPGDHLTISIEFNNTLGDLDLALMTASGNVIDTSALSTASVETVAFMAYSSDVYYILVAGKAGSYANIGVEYNMSIILAEFDDQFESNDNAQTASPIAEGDYIDLILRDKDDDWYFVYLASTDVIEIDLTYVAGTWGSEEYFNDIDLDLLYDDQSLAVQSRTLFNETLNFTATQSGLYYIVCVIDGSSNQYNLSIDIVETDDIYEDNDALAHATRIDVVDTVPEDPVSAITSNLRMRVKDDDYFVTELPAGLTIIVEVSFGTGQDLDLELLYPNGSVIDSSRLTAGTAERVGPFPMNNTYTDDFNSTDIYMRVYMDSGLATVYTLNITIGPEEVLITRQSVPPFTSSTSKIFKPGFFDTLLPLAAGGAIIGGGSAGLLYAGKRTGALEKAGDALKKRFGRGGSDSGTGGSEKGIKRSRRKPPDET
ncbi:MAG: hypothetical protein ACXACP_00530 [Candidatus Hodarchaeales archaeon]|jgi:hypothetical protein